MAEFPLRNPWAIIDYASGRGESHRANHVEILADLPLIDCGLGESPFGVPLNLIEILRQKEQEGTLAQELIEAIGVYPRDKFTEDPIPLIRERFGLSDKPVVVFHGEGSYGLLAQIILELPDLTKAEEIGILGIGPQFPNIVGLAEKHGRFPDGSLRFPYRSIQPSLDFPLNSKVEQLIEEIKNNYGGPRFIYLDNPNNPTGDFAQKDIIEKLVEASSQAGHIVIVDEAYGDVIPDDQSAVSLTEKYPNLIVVRGTAKIIGSPGLRVGYGVFSKEIGEVFQSLQLVFGVSAVQQLFLPYLLDPKIIMAHTEEFRKKARPIKEELINGLQNLGIRVVPTHPNVPILLAVGPVDDFFQRLKRYQIVTERGSDFNPTYPLTDAAVRIRIPKNLETVWEILRRIELALNE